MSATLGWGLIGASTIAARHMIAPIWANGGEVGAAVSANADEADPGRRLFQEAVDARGAPAATGEDGLNSPSVAIATFEAAPAGRKIAVDLAL